MATKKVYDACCRAMKKGRHMACSSTNPEFHRIVRPPLKELFGHKCLVSETGFMRCCEREKRCHLNEDSILRVMYLERRI